MLQLAQHQGFSRFDILVYNDYKLQLKDLLSLQKRVLREAIPLNK